MYPMIVLALDTSVREGSAALVDDDRVVAERAGDPSRTHAERLPGECLTLLAAHRVSLSSVELFAVASGPGSFTGLRVGIAAMQGFAAVTGRPIVGVPVLEALGHLGSAGRAPGSLVAVWMDAHRHDVFAVLYRVMPAALFEPEHLAEVEPPAVGTPSALLNAWRPSLAGEPVVWIGDGATAAADAIARSLPAAPILPHPLAAGAIGRLAIARARRGEAGGPATVQPVYLRRPDAEIDRDRRAAEITGVKGRS